LQQLSTDHTKLAERFGAVYTAALTDVMDALGYRHQTLSAEIVPLADGMRTAGPVFTVEGRGEETDRESGIRRILEMLGSIPAHHVAVYQAGDDTCAHFGELSATALKVRGCAGVVIDGGCRDIDLIKPIGLPVYARYSTPQDAVGRWNVLEWGHTVEIGGVTVSTGDYVVADTDGVAVVPAAVRDQVLEKAEAVVRTETEVRAAVERGMAPLDAYERFGKF
jgi:regulator of RNase E activity RraA